MLQFPPGVFSGRGPLDGNASTLLPVAARTVFYGDGIGSIAACPGEANYPTVFLGKMGGRVRAAVGFMQHHDGFNLDTIFAQNSFVNVQKSDLIIIGTMGHNDGLLQSATYAAAIAKWDRNVQDIFDSNPQAKIIVSNSLDSSVAGEDMKVTAYAHQVAFVAGLGSRAVYWDAAAAWNHTTGSNDGIHANQVGGNALASSLFTLVDPLVTAATIDDILNDTGATSQHSANFDADWALTGTTGTKLGTVTPTGSYAVGKRITNNLTNGTSVAVVCSKDATPGTFERQVTVLSGTPAASNTLVPDDTASFSFTGSTPGKFYEWLVRLCVDDGAGGVPVGFRAWSIQLGALGIMGSSGNLAAFAADKAEKMDYVLRMPPGVLFGSSGPTSINPTATLRFSPTALTARVIMERHIVREIELLAYATPAYIGGDGVMGVNFTNRLTGTGVSGSNITAATVATMRLDPGVWSGGGITFTRAMRKNGVTVSGAFSSLWTYDATGQFTAGDAIAVDTTATNSFGAVTNTVTYSVV